MIKSSRIPIVEHNPRHDRVVHTITVLQTKVAALEARLVALERRPRIAHVREHTALPDIADANK